MRSRGLHLTPLLLGACAAPKMAWEHAARPGVAPAPVGVEACAPAGGGLEPRNASRQRYFATPATDPATTPWSQASTADPPGTLRWPLAATGVTSLFGARLDPVDGEARFHYGVDLQAPYGTAVTACAPGVVVSADWNHGHGRQVSVEHAGGYRTSYSHLASIFVYPGMHVEAGRALGLVGNSGRSTGPHLHLEVTRHGTYVDPLAVLGAPGAP